MRGVIRTATRWLAQATTTLLRAVIHPVGTAGWSLLNRTALNYAALVKPDASPIVIACVRWVQRTFTEAPPVLQEWIPAREDWQVHQRDPILDLLERPNSFYNGATLWKATIADLMLNGTAYWLKVRSATGRVVALWWAPESLIEPKGNDADRSVFISHYEYRPGTGEPITLREQDVVQFRDGIDPANVRKGLSPIKSLFREIFTDDEAANMTASLLRNMGVPGVIISPESGIIGKEAGLEIKAGYMANFGGDKKGEPLVLGGAAKVIQFGFSPEQMQLRALRGIPEERITAVLGVNAAVVGLGSGLSTTKVGATLREYREEAFESTIIPLYREMGSELTHQLLRDFKPTADWRVAFDLSRVRVLQDDENKRAERLGAMLASGGITIGEYRRALGLIVLPEHELYLRKSGQIAIPAGTSAEDQFAFAREALANRGPGRPPGSALEVAVHGNGAAKVIG